VHRYITHNSYELYRTAIIARRHNGGLSQPSLNTLKIVSIDNSSYYRSPGVRQTSEQFILALQQNTVYCDESFGSTDCLMLSSIIGHRSSRISKLIFSNVNALHPNYEFDLLPAIRKSKSLRSLSILGGQWTCNFISSIVNIIQTECPTITEIALENILYPRDFTATLSSQVGALISDYFNYSVPGLCFLSLHGLQLRDYHVTSLAEGFRTNTSIKNVQISCNLLEDSGLFSIFSAISANNKSAMACLDLSHNLVTI
jgi:hypothetical protein